MDCEPILLHRRTSRENAAIDHLRPQFLANTLREPALHNDVSKPEIAETVTQVCAVLGSLVRESETATDVAELREEIDALEAPTAKEVETERIKRLLLGKAD